MPEWIKVGVPGEKYLGKDHDGWEYTSHDLWKKKLVWKSHWKKIWKPGKKQIWVPSKKVCLCQLCGRFGQMSVRILV